MRLTIDLMPAGTGKVWLYVDGHRHGPYDTIEQAAEEAACELRHHFRIETDPDYATAVGARPACRPCQVNGTVCGHKVASR